MWFNDIDIKTDHAAHAQLPNGRGQTRPEILLAYRLAEREKRGKVEDIKDGPSIYAVALRTFAEFLTSLVIRPFRPDTR